MKKYLKLFKTYFISGLQYKANAFGGIVTQFFWGFLLIQMYKAFSIANPSQLPMEMGKLSTYIWLQQSLLAIVASWILDRSVFNTIVDGNIAYEISRPMDLYTTWLVRNIGYKLSAALLRFAPVLIVASFLPKPYGFSLPESPIHFLYFLISLVLTLILTASYIVFAYILSIYTLSPNGILALIFFTTDFFTGNYVPLPFFPDGIRELFEKLPFAYMENISFRIYIGDFPLSEIPQKIFMQLVWVIIFILVGKLFMGISEKKITIQGG